MIGLETACRTAVILCSGIPGMCEGQATLNESQTQELRAELNSLLESPSFRTSKRCREFLEYIVEHTISGPSGTLKERSIGVELFQLPQDFDTGQRTIVRVTANEVRKKLAQHYLAENGTYHPVKIHLLPGSYSADFKWESPPPPVEVPAPAIVPAPEAARKRWFGGAMIAAGMAVLLLVCAFVLWQTHAVKTITVD